MNDIFKILQDLNIQFEKHEHPPLYTCEDAEKHLGHLDGAKDKNLFLRNRRGNKHYLISMESEKRLDLKALGEILGESKLSFASPERLKKYLNLFPGSVTPFGLINDESKEVEVIVDEELIAHEKLQFHPNTNTATLIVKSEDFKKFLDWTGNKIQYLKI